MQIHPAAPDRHRNGVCYLNAVANLLGTTKSQKVSNTAALATEEEKKKAKKAKSALLETEGGILGNELQPGQVSNSNLFGN